VFSCRSPHRPNNIGLSLVKLAKVNTESLLLEGIDLIDGTPVLDIKPYIGSHDFPVGQLRVAEWVEESSDLNKGDF